MISRLKIFTFFLRIWYSVLCFVAFHITKNISACAACTRSMAKTQICCFSPATGRNCMTSFDSLTGILPDRLIDWTEFWFSRPHHGCKWQILIRPWGQWRLVHSRDCMQTVAFRWAEWSELRTRTKLYNLSWILFCKESKNHLTPYIPGLSSDFCTSLYFPGH
jgi:hypothetical protein